MCSNMCAKGFAFEFGGVFTMLPRGTATSDVLEICAEGILRVVSRGEGGVALLRRWLSVEMRWDATTRFG